MRPEAGEPAPQRGQVLSFDIALSVSIFALLFVFLVGFWAQNYQGIVGERLGEQMRSKTVQAIDLLVKSPGYPVDWNNDVNNASAIGLAATEYVLSPAKLSAFRSVGYEVARQKMGVGNYEFYFTVVGLDSSTSTLDVNVGRDVNSDTTIAFEAKRIVTYGSLNSRRAEVKLKLWR